MVLALALSLQISIYGLESDKGMVWLELLDKEGKTISAQKIPIKNNQATVHIQRLEPGHYAVRFFHDKNSNSKLDTNFLGIPTEGYGFSNNAKPRFGPPSLADILFELHQDKAISIKAIR
jgi:uncharacterized protein (DUF2141 family)